MEEEKTSWTQEERKVLLNFGRAMAAYQSKKYEIAKIVLERTIEMDSNHYKSYLMLATIYSRENNREKMLFNLQKAISTNDFCKKYALEGNFFEAFLDDEDFIKMTK